MHVGMCDLAFPELDHARGAGDLMPDDSRRAFVRRSVELSQPNRHAVHQAARECFQAASLPSLLASREIEGWLAVQMVEVGADELRLLEACAVVADEVRNAARRVDLVVRAAFFAGLSQ